MDTKTEYYAYDQIMLMHQVGNRYETDQASDSPEWFETFKTEAEAETWIEGWLKQIGDPYTVIEAKSGLDSIEYHELGIYRLVWVEDYGDWDVDQSYEHAVVRTLPDDVREAALAKLRR